jgi:trimeric autotransporter adhesin
VEKISGSEKDMMKKLLVGIGILAAVVCFAPQTVWPTVSNTVVSTTTGYGNGVTVNFTPTFDFRSNSWLVVTLVDTSTNPATETSIPMGAGAGKFTVTGGNPGTTVVMGTAPTSTQYLVITRNIPLTQPVVFNPASIFPYQGLSSQLDQVTLTLQNLNSGVGGGSGGGGGVSGSLPSPGAPYDLIGWNSAGASTVNATVAYDGGGSTFQVGDILQFNGAGWATYLLNQTGLMQTLNSAPNTPLAAASGGSGVTNVANINWGTHTVNLTTSGTTNLTLPTSGTVLTGTATNNNTPSTIVSRDSSGNFSAGTITASLSGNVTGNVTGNLTGNASGTASNVTGVVAVGNGGTGQTTQQNAINALLNSTGLSSGRFARWDGANVTLDTLHTGDVPQGFSRLKLAQDTPNTLITNDAQGNMSVLAGLATGNIPIFNGVSWAVGPQGSGLAGMFPYGDDTGAADAYVVATPNPPILGYAKGVGISFVAAHSNTGASATLNVSSLGVAGLKRWDGTNLSLGDIITGQMVLAEYDGTNFQLIDPNTTPSSLLVRKDQANTYSGGPQDFGTQSIAIELPNDGGTGTTVNKLAKINSSGNVVIVATTDTSGVTGVVVSGAGTSGSATLAQLGQASCVFDGATTAGDFVQISSTVTGDCHDTGSSITPTTGQALGRVLSTHGGGGTYALSLLAGGSSGSVGSFTPGSVIFADGTGALSQDNANFFWASGTHRLGIGTTTPSAPLDLEGSGNAIINNGSLLLGGATSPGQNAVLQNNSAYTDPATSVSANLLQPTFKASSGAVTNQMNGIESKLIISGTNSQNFTNGTGVNSILANYVATAGATGTITNAGTLYTSLTNNASGLTITNYRGLRVTNPTNSGTITGVAGVEIDNLNTGNNNTNLLIGTASIPTTGNYSIYNASANTSYFNANVGIGTTAPSQVLDVNGTARLRTLNAAGVVTNDATGVLATVAPSTAGNLLRSTGAVWASATPITAAITVTGSASSPTSITTSGITSVAATPRVINFVQGSGGAVTVTANPAIAAGTIGQEMVVCGESDTNTLSFTNGNGLGLKGDITLTLGDCLTLVYDGTNWQETARNY